MEFSVITILTGTILGFIAGTSLTWTSPELGFLNQTETGPFNGNLSTEDASWISGVLSLGAALGPFFFGFLSDKIGRKRTILVISVPFIISSFASAFANQVSEFLVARFITGLGVGGTFTILPLYIGEISLDQHRAVLGSGMNCFICFGLFFTYCVGYFVSKVLVFNLILGLMAVAFFLLFLLIGAESPQFFIRKRDFEAAKCALRKIRASSDMQVDKELEMMRTEFEKEPQGNFLDIFQSKGTFRGLIIGSGLVFFQQTSGINAVLFFAQNIFKQAGTSLNPAYCSMIIGSVQFATSFITPILGNLAGRRVLLIFSSIGMVLSEMILGLYGVFSEHYPDSVIVDQKFLPIFALVCYILTYNVGFGPLPWAIIGEIFPNNVRSSASSLATAICWFTSFLITNWFVQVVQSVGQGECFLGFSAFSLLAGIFAYFCVLETKGKSLAEIQKDLNQ